MTLIASISGIRGTIGGNPGGALTPLDIVQFTSAYGTWLRRRSPGRPVKVVIGRDARLSGKMVSALVEATLQGLGVDVIDLDLSTTPTVAIAVPRERAQGGIVITASHNPQQWNALKLLNEKGEFITEADGKAVLALAQKGDYDYATVDQLGDSVKNTTYLQQHIEAILALDLVDVPSIKEAKLHVVVDGVHSTGELFVPALLRALGAEEVTLLYGTATGDFPHDPEPLPENLTAISATVPKVKADLGIVVDPDVDRLAFVCEDGSFFGEEYTLVAIADYVLKHTPGSTVSNLSSTMALKEVTERYPGCTYAAAAVGEVNVVEKMKATKAVIGGEGNGGVIYPAFHYGRDALVGIALFLTHLAHSKQPVSQLRTRYPHYVISKNKVQPRSGMDVDTVLNRLVELFSGQPIDRTDGVKIHFEEGWVHLRKSNTEAIIRIYAESATEHKARQLAERVLKQLPE